MKSAAQSEDLNRIKNASEQVEQAFHALSQQLYAQGQQQPQPEGQAEGGPSNPGRNDDGDVIEGEVKDM